MTGSDSVKRELENYIKTGKKEVLAGFFKTGRGGYGEGDLFLGVVVPDQRRVALKFWNEIDLDGVAELLKSPVHEHRLTALLILVKKYSKASSNDEEKRVYETYIQNLEYVNNWDLVDASAPYISGPYLYERSRRPLFAMAKSGDLWRQRVAMLSTYYFIRQGDFEDAMKIADMLMGHPHDLIHKAVGWMIREIGNRDREVEIAYLRPRYSKMPRTMLRYAIEKFEESLRKSFLAGTFK